MDQNQERRRGHFHRGRRGPDRRGIDRRTQPQQVQGGRDQIDVEQIMRDIRARIAQRQGIDLSNQQIQDLAARRLESILDPRAIRPSLLEGLRRSAGAPMATAAPKPSSEPVYTFDHTTIYDSPRAVLRFIRRLLNPLLKLFFNPNPLIRALHLQARLNVEAAEREAERDRRQTEWNALHYEIVQRVVTDVSRVSLELQALSMRIESLNARIDFNDRRVRSLEGAAQSGRAVPRAMDTAAAPASVEPVTTPEGAEAPTMESVRRRRRRRRGRRGGIPQGEGSVAAASAPVAATAMPTEQEIAGGVAPASTDTDSIPPVPQTPMGEPIADRAPRASEDRGVRTEDRELVPVPSPEPEPFIPTAVVSEEQTAPTEQGTFEPPDTDRSDQ
jgi:cell division protein FtsL